MVYDVLVIGAGPAGSVLAYLLAKQGLRILILERAHLPRYKTCGGGVTFKTFRCLPFDATPTFEVQAIGGIVTYAGKPVLKTDDLAQPFAWLVMRDRFDYYLVEQAVQAGAELAEGIRVRLVEQDAGKAAVYTENGTYQGRLLAGADGVNSIVAHTTGLLGDRRTGSAIEAELGVPPSAIEAQGPFATFDFGALPNGYGWIFPKKDHLSVGLFQASTDKAPHLKEDLQRFIACQPVLERATILQQRGHPIPLGGKAQELHRGRILLVGDAANLADPWLGEGIYSAVLSANLAAETMVKAISNGDPDLSSYTRQMNAGLVRQLRHAQRLGRIVYRAPRLASIMLGKSHTAQSLLFKTIRGDLSYRALNYSLLCNLPRILIELSQRGGPHI